jgi:hypothetical protein
MKIAITEKSFVWAYLESPYHISSELPLQHSKQICYLVGHENPSIKPKLGDHQIDGTEIMVETEK